VANVTAGANDILHAGNGDSTSTACPGSSTVTQHSQVLNLFGSDVPFPTDGCDDGTPNTNFTPLSPLLAAVCNASDENGGQTAVPYGVREALTLFALIQGDSSLVKVGVSNQESHAVAAAGVTPPGGNPGGNGGGTQGAGGKGGNGNGNAGGNAGGGAGAGAGGGAGAGAGAAAANAAAGNGNLAFTGADLLVLGLVGSALILGGLALTTAGRRHRQTV
jgi:hypothetical protein